MAVLALIGALLSAALTAWLAWLFATDEPRAFAFSKHRREQLPKVMVDRYIAMTALAIMAALYGDMRVIAGLFACLAFMGFADAYIYHRAGHSILNHIFAGVGASIVMLLALIAA